MQENVEKYFLTWREYISDGHTDMDKICEGPQTELSIPAKWNIWGLLEI